MCSDISSATLIARFPFYQNHFKNAANIQRAIAQRRNLQRAVRHAS